MPKKFYKDIPADYPICQYADCPRAATCLHQLVYQPLVERDVYPRLINPNRCTKDEQCPYYRDSTPVPKLHVPPHAGVQPQPLL